MRGTTAGPTVMLVRPWDRETRRLGGLSRQLELLIAGLLAVAAGALWAVIDPVMEAIYFERAPAFMNGLIANRDVHDLARYQDDARLLLGPRVRDALTVAGLLVLHAFVHVDLVELSRRQGSDHESVSGILRGAWARVFGLGRIQMVSLVSVGTFVIALVEWARPLLALGLVAGTLVGLKLRPDQPASERTKIGTWRQTALVMTALGVLASALVLFRIGDHDFREDEFQVIGAAYTHAQVGTYQQWNWIDDVPGDGVPYTRASQHTWLIARFIEAFGMSEGVTRLPGAFAGILLTVLAYPMMLRTTRSRGAALVTSVFVLLAFVGTFRYARMYALVVPLAFVWTFIHAEALRALPKSFARAGILFTASAGVGWLAYQLHINTLSLAAAFALPTAVAVHAEVRYRGWPRRTLSVLWLLLAVAAVPLTLRTASRVSGFLSPFERRNFAYVDVLFANPLPSFASGAVGALLIGVALGAALRRHSHGLTSAPFTVLSLSSLAFAIPFFVLIADRYVSSLYVAHVRVLTLAAMATGLGHVLAQTKRRSTGTGIVAVIIALALVPWTSRIDAIYFDGTGFGVHSKAYAVIAMDLDPSTDVILGQYFRSYYAQDPTFRATSRVGMGNNRSFTMTDLEIATSGATRAWVTWEARKSYHLREDVKREIRERGLQVSGPGVDETRVFVYLIVP